MPNATSTASQAAVKRGAGRPTVKSDAISLLKADHRKVEKLFAQFEESEDDNQKQQIVHQVCTELIVHTKIEEELFYPACRDKDVEDDALDEAQVEHDGAKVLIADLLGAEPGGDYYDAKVKTLSEYIKHHVGEEERPRSGIFAKAQKAGVDMAALGQKLQARKAELMVQSETLSSKPPQPRSFTLNPQGKPQESSMARYYDDRDEQGRFTSDDDRRYQSRGQGNYRERDEQGRFVSDDERGYSSRGNGNQERDARGRFASDYDDDRGGSRGRGQGGWFGDPEGHSRASREGWDDRGPSRSRGYDDDQPGRYSRSGGRGQGGWFGDSEGHSEASREGWRHSGHEGSGWYGDPEGHSQASREGWEDRGRYSGRQSSRGRDDDEDYRSRGGRGGHGGWFGDPQGHSQASREGWRNR